MIASVVSLASSIASSGTGGVPALIELTPLWVRFLVAQGLLEAEAGEEALSELKQVAEDMSPVIRAEMEPAQVLRYWEAAE